jgi:hypothetical protein
MQRIVAAIALGLIIVSCTGADRPQQAQSDATVARRSESIAVEWSDADLEDDASRIGYGSNPEAMLARDVEGALVFMPQTPRDHLATQFIELAPHDGGRSLELVLDVKSPGGEACVANLQDQEFNVLGTVPCRSAGEQRATAHVPPTVTRVRVYFQSMQLERLPLPVRMRLNERR